MFGISQIGSLHRAACLLALAGIASCGIALPVANAGDDSVCETATGNCFIPHGQPGCDLLECCHLICNELAPVCCDEGWDSLCAGAAMEYCDTTFTCPGTDDCYEAHASPSCVKEDCCVAVCDQLPACCQIEWTEECAELAFDECPCGAPGSGDCFAANETHGCEDLECCSRVCGMDAFCCFAGWEETCVIEASQFCGVPACDLQCPADATPEAEVCGQEINAGCNADNPHDPKNPAFTPIGCGETFCGTVFADGPRDTDWYEITVTEPTALTWSAATEFPAALIIVEGNCDTRFGAVAEAFTSDCAPGEVTVCVQPGTYFLFLSSAIEERNLRAGIPCPSCAEDLNGDGLVGPFDLALLLGNWGPCPPGDDCPPDFTEDEVVGPLDLAILLDAWGPCGQPPEAIWGNDYVATLTCTPCGN